MTIYRCYPYMIADQDIRDLAELGIRQTCERLSVKLDYQDLPTKYSSESDQHRALKKFASKLLEQLGEKLPCYEYAYYDVYSPTLNIIIECGDTTLSKILEAFFRWFRTNLKELWVLEYPNVEGYSDLMKFIRDKVAEEEVI